MYHQVEISMKRAESKLKFLVDLFGVADVIRHNVYIYIYMCVTVVFISYTSLSLHLYLHMFSYTNMAGTNEAIIYSERFGYTRVKI